MRGKGINYDTGARMSRRWTREEFDSETARRELEVIRNELHCNAVRITGSDPERLSIAGEQAAELGLEVWLAPFLCELTTEQMLPVFADCADRAEKLRAGGAEVVLIVGAELSIFAHGFLPGEDLLERVAVLTPGPDRARLVSAVPARLNAFLREVMAEVRQRFGGKVTYASLPFEGVEWTLFDYVGADAYRSAGNAATFRDEVRALHRHGLPVVVTEFGCCTYRGAADVSASGWMIVDRDTWTLNGSYERDEEEQATYFREVFSVYDSEGVDTAFWFTFASYLYPHHPDPQHDLDLAAYGVIRLHQDGTWSRKSVFDALATTYSTTGATS